MENKMPEILNWQQACKLLSCSKSHFYNLINSGELPAIRLGRVRCIRVKQIDCKNYLEGRTEE